MAVSTDQNIIAAVAFSTGAIVAYAMAKWRETTLNQLHERRLRQEVELARRAGLFHLPGQVQQVGRSRELERAKGRGRARQQRRQPERDRRRMRQQAGAQPQRHQQAGAPALRGRLHQHEQVVRSRAQAQQQRNPEKAQLCLGCHGFRRGRS